VELVGIEPTSI